MELYGGVAMRHDGIIGVPLNEVCEHLLFNIGVPDPEENQAYVGVLFQIDRYLRDNPDESCDVFNISPDTGGRRAINVDEKIDNIFQGFNRKTGDPLSILAIETCIPVTD